jgi:hypothetical protein
MVSVHFSLLDSLHLIRRARHHFVGSHYSPGEPLGNDDLISAELFAFLGFPAYFLNARQAQKTEDSIAHRFFSFSQLPRICQTERADFAFAFLPAR